MPVAERWITGKEMAEAVKKAKVNRKNKLASFTRQKKRLKSLIEGGSEEPVLRQAYSELSDAYKVVENAHEELCLLLEEDDEDAANNYLDEPSDSLSEMQLQMNRTIADRGKQEKVANDEAEKKKEQA